MRIASHRHTSRFAPSIGFALLLISVICIRPAIAAKPPTSQPAGVIAGKVSSPGTVPLSEMVVYLESAEPGRTIVVPKARFTVSQKGAKFSPALTIICVGQTVDFPNDEKSIEHNVFSNTPVKRFDLGIYDPGETRSVTFEMPGAVYLYCSIHRYMDGIVFIAPTPFTSRVAEDGSYRIEGVPPGKWILKTWQRRRRFPELTIPVLIGPGKTMTTALELRKP